MIQYIKHFGGDKMSKYLHEDIETMNREDIEKLQSERLVKQVKRATT